MTVTRVLLARHGQSEGNVANLWTSQVHGYPLTERGREQARTLGKALAERGVTGLYASPILRAQQTAQELSAYLGLDVVTLEGVQELDVGVHEGKSDDEVAPIARHVFGRWLRAGDLTGGFDGGESGHQVVVRMTGALDSVARDAAGGTAVVVSHGGAIALWGVSVCPQISPAFVVEHLLDNCDVVELERRDDGWHCLRWAGIDLLTP